MLKVIRITSISHKLECDSEKTNIKTELSKDYIAPLSNQGISNEKEKKLNQN
jgi:hypothetical protein